MLTVHPSRLYEVTVPFPNISVPAPVKISPVPLSIPYTFESLASVEKIDLWIDAGSEFSWCGNVIMSPISDKPAVKFLRNI